MAAAEVDVPRRIVVAIDDSAGSAEALNWALENMALQKGERSTSCFPAR